MKFFYKLVVLLFSMAMSQTIYAASCTQRDNSIGVAGVSTINGDLYVQVTDHDNQCGCGVFRFSPLLADTDKVLSIVLSSKLASQKVRIDLYDETDCDTARQIYIQ